MRHHHTWIDNLELEVEQEIDHDVRSKGPSRHEVGRPRFGQAQKSDEGKWGVALFVLAVMLTVGLVGAIVWKRNADSPFSWNIVQRDKDYYNSNNWRQESPPRYQDRISQRDFDQMREAQVKIWERTKWNTDVMTLMSIVDNHNLAVAQNNHPKSHYIYLNTDWTIDRIPQHVNLSAEDRAFLQKYVKPKVTDTESK